ncbi:DUF3761 domain-containing protein [bacterium]|nr:MAG: DUF3761 domain-containing protein [bacterium]
MSLSFECGVQIDRPYPDSEAVMKSARINSQAHRCRRIVAGHSLHPFNMRAIKHVLPLALLLLVGCTPKRPDPNSGSSSINLPLTSEQPTPEQSALHPQSNNSPKNSLPPKSGSTEGACPIGATAACKDGSFTDSKNRKIACNQHGGVARWCH